ncbi:Deoxyribonuclease-2-alpha [Trichinella nativa]|uniref:Deoxyribonuclease-2-alpha n=1 Tax=Trichinella nativa TaxID=6335 RepID=A0A0V1KMX1_9BILA|nr:Deoxyribonuclease-2-alpha [Trichinella nativa]
MLKYVQLPGAFRAILYKAPGQIRGKIIVSNSAGAWTDGNGDLTQQGGQSFGGTLEHVVQNHDQIKFLAYNNVPPGMPNVKTKSNSKGVIIVQTTQNIDAASWIVHTVPGFPAAKTGYSWPVAENAKGHILICLTISESQINAIAASLLRAEPLVHYNDIPETETVGMQYFKKLSDGQFPTVPPYLSRQSIKTAAQAAVTVNVYSKSAASRYEIYKRVIVKALKKTIKVWSRRDNKLKGDCRVVERNIRLIKSPARVGDHDTNLDADLTNWAVSDPGNIFCLIDRPYAKNQTVQSAMAVCIDQADIFARFNDIAAQVEDCPEKRMLKYVQLPVYFILITFSQSQNPKCRANNGGAEGAFRAILYKAPGQIRGKIIVSNSAGAWTDGNGDLTQQGGQSFGGTLEHVVQNHDQIKFLAYNNVPPGMPNVKTKSNSKGVIIVQTTQNIDAASWIVHTVPGFPAAKTGYSWPVAENAKGHILICLTISESQINAIAASLLRAEPLVHYNDIPETETVGMQYFKKLSDGQFPTVPPYLSRQSIKTAAQAAVTVNVYSKSAASRYEIYKRVIVKALKKTIKVWSRRDNKLKGDCRVVERNIRLIKSPARVGDHDTNLDADLTNWAVSDPGNIFCLIDRPYAKNQTVQSAMAVCIDQADIFARFNDIAAQVEDCPNFFIVMI